MTPTLILGEVLTGLLVAGFAMAAMLLGSALVLGRAISLDGAQREPRVAVVPPVRYVRRVRGSSTSRTESPTTFTARIRPKSAVDAASRFQPITGSRASSSRA